ncbi:MAG: hypothetical protein ACT6QS_10720 [Flavobacteriales bacterium]
MKQALLKSTTSAFFAILFAGCGSDKPNSTPTPAERITFPSVEYTISAAADTTLFGEQGTRLFIEQGTFQFADGTPVTDSIQITLKEFYEKSDIALADLSTESNGKLLETGGMLHIAATSRGQEIRIKSDKRIVVHFPKPKDSDKEMNLFYAQSATDSSVSSWEIDTVNLVKRTLRIGAYAWNVLAEDDPTTYNFTPKNKPDTGYYWNPLDLYLNTFTFSPETKKEIESNLNSPTYPELSSWNDYGIECEMSITKEGYIKNPQVNSKVSGSTRKEIISFLKNLPQLEPGKNKNGEIIERTGLLFIKGGNIVPLYKSSEAYLKSFDKKYARFEKTPVKNMDDAELDYYIFSVAKLGWINCDRFLELENTIDYIVQLPASSDTKLKMVFSDIDGVLMAKVRNGHYAFSGVPSGRQVTLVAIKNTGAKLQTAFKSVAITNTPLTDLAFTETTLAELRQNLEKLN